MADIPIWEICERVAEVQALLDDHVAGGKHSVADVVAVDVGRIGSRIRGSRTPILAAR